jgi:Mn-containing catalase
MTGPWNDGPQWNRIDDLEQVMAADKSDGQASVKLSRAEGEPQLGDLGRLVPTGRP